MQHHAHAARVLPPMRGHMAMHPSSAVAAAVAPTPPAPAAAPPPPQPNVLSLQPAHLRDYHNRLNHQPHHHPHPHPHQQQQQHQHQHQHQHHLHHPASMHTSATQMQKLRQQHQHLNQAALTVTNNNCNNINNNGNGNGSNSSIHSTNNHNGSNSSSSNNNNNNNSSGIANGLNAGNNGILKAPPYSNNSLNNNSASNVAMHQQQQQQQQQQHPQSPQPPPPPYHLPHLKGNHLGPATPNPAVVTPLVATTNMASSHVNLTAAAPGSMYRTPSGSGAVSVGGKHGSGKFNATMPNGGGRFVTALGPKSILQNPNRPPKPRIPPAGAKEPLFGCKPLLSSNANGNNITIMPEPSATAATTIATATTTAAPPVTAPAPSSSSGPGAGATTTPVVSAALAQPATLLAPCPTPVAAGGGEAPDAQHRENCEQGDSGSKGGSSSSSSSSSSTTTTTTTTTTTANNNNRNSNSNCPADSSSSQATNESSAHATAKKSTEKTPMCLVNELARFNKITHQYRLTSEKGPPHCKRFTVTLKLGEEEYSAEGFKIKKAQHLAAAEAIEKTKYKHPVPKSTRRTDEAGTGPRVNITPTVELNALAMKLGQQTFYLFDPRQLPPNDPNLASADSVLPAPPVPPPYNGPPLHRQALDAPPPLPPHQHPHAHAHAHPHPHHHLHHHQHQHQHQHHVRLMEAPAYGRRNGALYAPPPPPPPPPPASVQRYCSMGAPSGGGYAQRHPLLAPPTPYRITLIVGKQQFTGIGSTLQKAKHNAAARALEVLKTLATDQMNDALNHSIEDSDHKSPISLVYEIGIKRSMTVHFKVLREEGPAHMKNFITACIVGSIVTEGEGNGKKISKKRAAEKMLDELKKLPPLTPTKSPIKRVKVKTPAGGSGGAGSGGSGGVGSTRPSSGAAKNPGVTGGERRKRSSALATKERAEKAADTSGDLESENPITKLIQLQQMRKAKEPVFELIAKNGNENARRREFIIEVSAQGMVARGTGNSKKLAKRNAAENLLIAMGVLDSGTALLEAQPSVGGSSGEPLENNNNSALLVDANSAKAAEATTTSLPPPTATATATAITTTGPAAPATVLGGEPPAPEVPLITTSAGQVPGILILRQNRKSAAKKKELSASLSAEPEEAAHTQLAAKASVNCNSTDSSSGVSDGESPTKPTAAANALNTSAESRSNTTSTSTSTSNQQQSLKTSSKAGSLARHSKDQLLYLAKIMGFEVHFSDYPKGNHNEYLTIVTLSTVPAQICHGVGISTEESQNDAARNALDILSELGLSGSM